MHEPLWQAFDFGRGDLRAKNSTFMGPMTLATAEPDGRLNDWIVEWYRARAKGGVGSIIGAAAAVHASGFGWANAMTIHTDDHIDGWKRCVDAAHADGVLFGTQLYHGGAASHDALLGHQPWCPSAWKRDGFDPAREMTVEEIELVIEAFADGARRSIEAGCDFVELHGAHGYLLHQFWRRDVNRREDKWGDSTLFATEVIKAVRAAVGERVPIVYRFSIHSDDPAATDEPVTPESLSVYLKALEAAGVDVWDISCWRESRRGYFGTTTLLPEWVRQASSLPRIVAGNFLEPAGAAEYCESGYAEGIALARGLISDAAWCERAQVGDSYRPYQESDLHELRAGRDPGV